MSHHVINNTITGLKRNEIGQKLLSFDNIVSPLSTVTDSKNDIAHKALL